VASSQIGYSNSAPLMAKPLFSVRMSDCTLETFRAGGKGGQNQNKRDTGVRIRHRQSLAVGESREHRTQLENKRAAFRKMAESREFQTWARIKALQLRPIDELVDEAMAEDNFKVETREEGKWVE
jgi:protein subunit release factor B